MAQPFQAWIFILSAALVILLTWSGLVSGSIRMALRLLEREAADGSLLDEALKREMRAQSERKTTGKVIGAIESLLYVYALVAGYAEILVGVLAFKGFTGWLAFKEPDQAHGKSLGTLVRFYSYAIGNFLSLVWAVVAFECVRWCVMFWPAARSLLWISAPFGS